MMEARAQNVEQQVKYTLIPIKNSKKGVMMDLSVIEAIKCT